MGTDECSQPASKSSWDSQNFGDVNMVLKMAHFHKASRPQWVKSSPKCRIYASMNWVSIGLANDLSPVLRRAINSTNIDLFLIKHISVEFRIKIRIKIQNFSFMKMCMKTSPAQCPPFFHAGWGWLIHMPSS